MQAVLVCKEHTLAEWQNVKYLISTVLQGSNVLSPTEFILKKVVKEQASHCINFCDIVNVPPICLTQPMLNAVVA